MYSIAARLTYIYHMRGRLPCGKIINKHIKYFFFRVHGLSVIGGKRGLFWHHANIPLCTTLTTCTFAYDICIHHNAECTTTGLIPTSVHTYITYIYRVNIHRVQCMYVLYICMYLLHYMIRDLLEPWTRYLSLSVRKRQRKHARVTGYGYQRCPLCTTGLWRVVVMMMMMMIWMCGRH